MRKVIPIEALRGIIDPTDVMVAEMNEVAPPFRLIADSFRMFEYAASLVDRDDPPHKEAVLAALRCPACLVGRPRVMYEHHARELVSRVTSGEAVGAGGDLRYAILGLATKAEVMWHLSLATLRSRLVSDVEGLYEKLFVEVFGPKPFIDEPRRPSHSTAYDELLKEFRYKLRTERDRPGELAPEERQQKAMDEAFGELNADPAE